MKSPETVPWNDPARYTFPSPSVTTSEPPESCVDSPVSIFSAKTQAPAASNCVTKIVEMPGREVSVVGAGVGKVSEPPSKAPNEPANQTWPVLLSMVIERSPVLSNAACAGGVGAFDHTTVAAAPPSCNLTTKRFSASAFTLTLRAVAPMVAEPAPAPVPLSLPER